MKMQLICTALLCGLPLLSTLTTANDKVAKVYNPDMYMKVCKGKSEGAHVSYAHRGIIWNGTCQQQFFATSKSALNGDEPAIYSTCSGTAGTTKAMINGQEVAGKCALGFTPPRPR